MNFNKLLTTIILVGYSSLLCAQENTKVTSKVNVFLGSSADHGQLSPGASYPLNMTDISPQTYPHIHTGYEYYAKQFLGFTHTRMEGVGCMGSGGLVLIKPFVGADFQNCDLLKKNESASPGEYRVLFSNGIGANIFAADNLGIEDYQFPKDSLGKFYIDLSHTLANGFRDESHELGSNYLRGWVDAGTTCSAGVFRLYYYIQFPADVRWQKIDAHKLVASLQDQSGHSAKVLVGLSSVSTDYALLRVQQYLPSFEKNGSKAWNTFLTHIKVGGGTSEQQDLFYSLLYRSLQSPYVISEKDGAYRNTKGILEHSNSEMYNGWSVWDNYKTQLPLLSFAYSDLYQNVVNSIQSLYANGIKDYATQTEPSNTVRTEHSEIVLLDAYRKGYKVDFSKIYDSIRVSVAGFENKSPDQCLEHAYDYWAISEIAGILNKKEEHDYWLAACKKLYQNTWKSDFQNMNKNDVDRMGARHMYQGTIWQYRWLVPYDIAGLTKLAGGEADLQQQLDYFFDHDLYNAANEPDIQAPVLFNSLSQPWKAQSLLHKYALDSVVQYYFNDNSRGIDPYVGLVYQNKPKAFVRTMDDDAGANSSWFVLAAVGLYPACVGSDVYYLSAPFFQNIDIQVANTKHLVIQVEKTGKDNRYIQSVELNHKLLNRLYLHQNEIIQGGLLKIVAGDKPNKQLGIKDQWISSLD